VLKVSLHFNDPTTPSRFICWWQYCAAGDNTSISVP